MRRHLRRTAEVVRVGASGACADAPAFSCEAAATAAVIYDAAYRQAGGVGSDPAGGRIDTPMMLARRQRSSISVIGRLRLRLLARQRRTKRL